VVAIGWLWSEVNVNDDVVGIRAIPPSPAELRRLPSACAWAILGCDFDIRAILRINYKWQVETSLSNNHIQLPRSGVMFVEQLCIFLPCLSIRLITKVGGTYKMIRVTTKHTPGIHDFT
jgi:hypothetical protein